MFGMLRIWRSITRAERQALFALIVVVLAAYIVAAADFWLTLREGEPSPYTPLEIVLLLLLGALYLYLLFMRAAEHPRFARNIVVLPLLLALVTAIQLLAAPGFMWLAALPLAGMIADTYVGWRQWALNAVVFLTMIAPYVPYGATTVFSILFTLGPAMLFVVAFSQLRLQESLARRRSEALTHELEAANHRLAEYATQAEELATSRERNRVAREIHDNLGHYLTVVNVQLAAAKILLDQEPARAREAIDKAQRLTQEGLQAVRHSVSALRGDPLAGAPLEQALTQLVNDVDTAGIHTAYRVLGTPRALDTRVALALFRAAQEGLTNVRKHARASHVDLQLSFAQPNAVHLHVRDNGVGADTAAGVEGFGLIGIRERAALLGGTIDINTAPGTGFALHVMLPG